MGVLSLSSPFSRFAVLSCLVSGQDALDSCLCLCLCLCLSFKLVVIRTKVARHGS